MLVGARRDAVVRSVMFVIGCALMVLGAWLLSEPWSAGMVQMPSRSRAPRLRLWVGLVALVLGLACAFAGIGAADAHGAASELTAPAPPAAAARVRVPAAAARYRHQVEQVAGDIFGVDASAARLAAQIHQESLWQADARSGVGAEGMAQFMPKTGKWLAAKFHAQLGAYDPWDPAWSIRAAAVYDDYLLARNDDAADACAHWAFALSAYNGGERALHREQRAAGAAGDRWFGATATHRARSRAAWTQNRSYVRRILTVLEPAYIDAGWSGQAVCT